MNARVHRSPQTLVKPRTARAAAGPRPPSTGTVGALFAALGALVYFATVLFAIGDGGLAAAEDMTAGRVTIGVAGALSGLGAVLGLMGFRSAGGKGAAFVGAALGLAFAAFAGWSLYRSF